MESLSVSAFTRVNDLFYAEALEKVDVEFAFVGHGDINKSLTVEAIFWHSTACDND